eukprot:764846-Hanusia_phi.AAC.2
MGELITRTGEDGRRGQGERGGGMGGMGSWDARKKRCSQETRRELQNKTVSHSFTTIISVFGTRWTRMRIMLEIRSANRTQGK